MYANCNRNLCCDYLVASQGLIESAKHNKEEKQPFIVPVISSISGSAFDTSSYLRVQLQYNFTLENVGDSPAVTVYTFRCSMRNLLSDSLLWYIGTSAKRTLKK